MTLILRIRCLTLCTLAWGVSFFSAPLFAQEAGDPFGEAPARPAAPRNGTASKPAADEFVERDPAVLAILASNPKTAEELTRALQLTMDLGRDDVAAQFVKRLLAMKLDEASLATLQQKFGSALFFRLSNNDALAPQGEQLSSQVMAAAGKVTRDPTRLSDRVIKLTDANVDTRLKALDDLRSAGDAAVGPLVRALVDERRVDEHLAVKKALVSLGEVVVEPLIGALEAPQDSLRANVFDVLGALRAPRALPYLLHPALDAKVDANLHAAAQRALLRLTSTIPSRFYAEKYLTDRVMTVLNGSPVVRLDLERNGVLWHWDGKLKMVVPRVYPADAVCAVEASRVSSELFALAAENADHRRLYLTAHLDAAKMLAGLDRPLPRSPEGAFGIASKFGPSAVEDLIPYATSIQRIPALIAALEVLGDIGQPELLQSVGGALRPMAKALGHVDRRVRFAAMEAILKINPRQPFAGASRITESLGYFAGSSGLKRVLVAYPRTDDAQSYVGMLSELGLAADAATTGREAFQLLVRQPDYEFAIISEFIDSPRASELLQSLRQETRTASLPIAVLVRPDQLEQVRGLYETDPLIEAFARPFQTDGVDFVVRSIFERARRRLVGRDERVRQAASALDWMAQLSETEHAYAFYELRTQEPQVEIALTTHELSARAAKVLGYFGTPRAQQALVDFASENARALSDRQAAAEAFHTAVRKRGVQLLRTTLTEQYARYNRSESLDQGTQTVLGSLLDTIETKGDRLKKADNNQQQDNDKAAVE